MDARHEFIDKNDTSTSVVVQNEGLIQDMPQIFEQIFRKKPITKVSKLK